MKVKAKMKKNQSQEQKQDTHQPSAEFQQFQDLARRLVSVPKKEVEQKETKQKKNDR